MTHYRKALTAAVLMFTTASLNAGPFTAIRIGDVDGFGFAASDVDVLKAANGSPVDTNDNGIIGIGEFLPDIPFPVFPINSSGNLTGLPATVVGGIGDGFVKTTLDGTGFDDFDNRSNADALGKNIGGDGFTSAIGTTGSEFTDLSISSSFGTVRVFRSPDSFIYVPAVYAAVTPIRLPTVDLPFAFPDASIATPNEPRFSFRFSVDKLDIEETQDLFFNMLIGDYDVDPAEIQLVLNNRSIVVLPLTVQPRTADGLVQGAFATLDFADVFSDGGSVWNGILDVKVSAPDEPFLAFDYVELSTRPIFRTPAPAALPLLLLGLAAAALRRRQRAT